MIRKTASEKKEALTTVTVTLTVTAITPNLKLESELPSYDSETWRPITGRLIRRLGAGGLCDVASTWTDRSIASDASSALAFLLILIERLKTPASTLVVATGDETKLPRKEEKDQKIKQF
jgi:hypothetical protein